MSKKKKITLISVFVAVVAVAGNQKVLPGKRSVQRAVYCEQNKIKM